MQSRALSHSICVASFLLTSVVVGCETTNQLAPKVNHGMLRKANLDEQSLGMLQEGRHLYITSCARCHSPEAVTSYSRERWNSILPRMSMKAALSPEEQLAVTEYVMTVLTVYENAPS